MVKLPVTVLDTIPVQGLVSSPVRLQTGRMNDVPTFAGWLKKQRTARRYSQGELANATGIARSYITRIEGGGVTFPEVETRDKMHEVFGTNDDDLVEAGVAVRREVPGPGGVMIVRYDAAPRPEDIVEVEVPHPDTWNQDDDIPAKWRTSFHKVERMTPERQQLVERLIDELDTEAEADRNRLRREE